MTSKNSVDTIIYEILKEFQEARWKAFVEEAMKGDPWKGFNGKDFF